uniref:Uncharacterized protein n=1 Tax=Caenorhabditis tropicalis TaxID=1561998 RepID=A0A1I7U2Z7_9PELO
MPQGTKERNISIFKKRYLSLFPMRNRVGHFDTLDHSPSSVLKESLGGLKLLIIDKLGLLKRPFCGTRLYASTCQGKLIPINCV